MTMDLSNPRRVLAPALSVVVPTYNEADNLPGLIPVRDSKRPSGPVVVFSAEGWGPFVAAVRGGRL